MNEENPRVEKDEREPNQGLTAPINEAETERALKGMKSGKAVGSDEIPAEVWKCLGWFGVVTLCKLFNSITITETIPSAWRDRTSTHLQGKGRHPRVQELQRDQAPD